VPVTPEMAAAATHIFKGEEPPTGFDKNAAPIAAALANKMQAETANILNDPTIKPGEYGEAVRKRLGPSVAADMQGMEDYSTPPGSTSGAGKQGDYLRTLEGIIKKDQPSDPSDGKRGWNAAYYTARERFRTDVNTQTVILRSNSLAADGNAVLDDLKDLQRQGVNLTGINLEGIVGMAARDPTYSKLAGDWYAYNGAFNTIVNAGRHVQSGEERQENIAPVSYASPAAFRAAIKGHMNDAIGYLEGEHQRWETIGGKPTDMPSYNPTTEKKLRDMRDMDYLTGTMPGQTYTNKNGVTKTWVGGSLNPYDPKNWK
jgi:hypothetical protein